MLSITATSLFDQIQLFGAILFLILLPGAFLVFRLLERTHIRFSPLEFLLISCMAGIALLDFGMLLLARSHIPFSRTTLTLFVALVLGMLFLLDWRRCSRIPQSLRRQLSAMLQPIGFSRSELLLASGLILLTLFIKSIFLWNTILPTATDLGHHMYWSKVIATTGTLPSYSKMDIVTENGASRIVPPLPIDDFIIGEHLPFAAIALVTSLNFLSAFPALVLLLVNLCSLLALSMLSFRLFEEYFHDTASARRGFLLTLFLAGPLWTLASPEAKYVSGGVVGNLFGNFLIPLTLLLIFRALKEKNSQLLALAFLSGGLLAYTHHLSTFVFLFIVLFIIVFFAFVNYRSLLPTAISWGKLLFSPAPLAILALLIFCVAVIYTPTYLDKEAIDTAVGAPSKATREGLSSIQLSQSVGAIRLGLGLAGLILLLVSKKRAMLSASLLIGWSIALSAMSLAPNMLFIDIPSNRVATYAASPFVLLAVFILLRISSKVTRDQPGSGLLKVSGVIAILLTLTLSSGSFDNAGSLSESTHQEATETFATASWLSDRNEPNDIVLKDHNYLAADAWMKLFFMRDYSYPLSRGLFGRYEDDGSRHERCSLLMISAPNTPAAQDCFSGTKTNLLVVNPQFDSAQFKKSPGTSLIYLSDSVAVYERK